MKKNIKKEITFFCTDKVERQCCDSIIKEAELRGYKVRVTDNKFEKAEIGIYLSHWNFPKHSKLSAVMLHDLGQQHGEWPMMWKLEFWDKFDLAFLPSNDWAEMWTNGSKYKFVRPRIGAFLTGWPKSDRIFEKNFFSDTDTIKEMIDSSKKTILYAPSWEWNERELEIATIVKDMDVNLLIKQFPATPTVFPQQYEIINKVHEKVRALNLSNVHILDSSVNIYDAISVCDVLVSEESSTLYEAMLMDKPMIAVTDWLVPDVNPPRLPEFPYDFAIHTEHKFLKQTLQNVLQNNDSLESIKKFREKNFSDLGNSGKKTMDVIDSILENKILDKYKIPTIAEEYIPKEYRISVRNRKFMLAKYEFVHTTKLGAFLFKIYTKLKCQNQ